MFDSRNVMAMGEYNSSCIEFAVSSLPHFRENKIKASIYILMIAMKWTGKVHCRWL